MSVRIAEICQETKYLPLQRVIDAKLDEKDCVEKVAYILHDKDVYTKEDEKDNPAHKAGTPKEEHIHIVLRFHKGKEQQYRTIAGWLGIAPQYVTKSTSKEKNCRDKFNSMLAYLVHRNAPEKFQYDISEVVANFDYAAALALWAQRKDASSILNLIDKGIINRRNFFDFIDIHFYSSNKSKIDAAFTYYDKKNKTIQRKMEVIYVTGPTGLGKTHVCKEIAFGKKFKEGDIFISGSERDMMDGYENHPVIILDDFRDDFISFSECLKMLDNNTNSKIGSRFYDKDISNCKLMFISTTVPMDDMYRFARLKESIVQLHRRCKTMLKMEFETVHAFSYNNTTDSYVYVASYENPAKELIEKTNAEAVKSEQEMTAFLGLTPTKAS